MKIGFGLKAHSGWAVLVAIGLAGDDLEVIERRRLELVTEAWAKQPYHAAENLESREAQKLVYLGIRSARQHALKEMQTTIKNARRHGHDVVGCGVLVGEPMPDWNTREILAVHFRMHKAEGVLFREALAEAATKCRLNLVRVPEKVLHEYAQKVLKTATAGMQNKLAALGKEVGAPWGKDQKEASLAAMIALQRNVGRLPL